MLAPGCSIAILNSPKRRHPERSRFSGEAKDLGRPEFMGAGDASTRW